MAERPQRYLSYLLRLWRTAEDETAGWRASLEMPGTGERRGFASLEELFRWLQEQAGAGRLLPRSDERAGGAKADDPLGTQRRNQ
jgi:hypothetical protein